MPKIKIFIVIDHLGAGGAQRQIIEFLKHVHRDNFDIAIVNLDRDYASVENEIESLGFRIIGIQHKGFFNPGTLFTLINLFRSEKPDIVHTYLFTADCYGRLAAKIAGIKVIICAIRADDIWKKWHHILTDKILAKFTNVITVNAEGLKRYLTEVEKIDATKLRTIYNGIDLKRFNNKPAIVEYRSSLGIQLDELVVGMVGRMSEQKNYKTLLEAAKVVVRQVLNVRFILVGDGPERKALELRVAGCELKDKVIFVGHRKDADSLMRVFDVGVLSSHYEGCPNVILEYMACSKPVVASDVGGCKELVVEGETGFIVSSADPGAMADRLLRLLKDEPLRMRMGAAGRKRAEENFISEKMARNTEQLYGELLNER
jgi:glycosyltransferase involved in cell wall biosynthesis